ncbi:MAG: transglutaminase family protein [Micrococcus sp.]|nr:transglutaminase family protein [Micrococcus sp.]
MTRIQISHRTRYTYASPVTTTYNEARMTPLTDATQRTLESAVTLAPRDAVASTYRDYWSTRVTAFDIHVPHTVLEVVATAVVDVHREALTTADSVERRSGEPIEAVGWEFLSTPDVIHEFSDFLPQTWLTTLGPEGEADVSQLRRDTPAETAEAVIAWLRERIQYASGTTSVKCGAQDSLVKGTGVCQDLAHIAIGALRHLGVPARYVSGYIHPQPDAGIGAEVAGESHAWFEWWDGSWHSWDPTNHQHAGDFHVLVGRGRDYTDITPFKGILSGGSGEGTQLDVEVLMTQLA